jgi:gas vesicle protein
MGMSAVDNGDGSYGGGMAFVVGLFFGTLIGATTAIFIAPASGRELRETLSRGAKRFAAQASDLVPEEWNQIAEEEIAKEIMDNVSRFRSAGL